MPAFLERGLRPLLLALISPLALDPAAGARADAAPALGSAAAAEEQVTSLSQFNDVKPSDWAYQALGDLVETSGCLAGYPDRRLGGGRSLSRYEAAALLNACLDRVRDQNDELKALVREFEAELAAVRGRVDGLEGRLAGLSASPFSTTTKLNGQATFVLGGNAFGGSSAATVATNQAEFGATSFNYDLQLNLDTSFTGRDLLRTTLRAGNFAYTSMGGAGPSSQSQLEIAFQQCAGEFCGDMLGIDRLYYQFPIGEFTATIGGRVGQEDMLALWPSVYPASTVLDILTLNGAPGAYNKTLGAGAGLWWQRDGWSVSTSYVAANGQDGNPQQGGIATQGSMGSATVQLGYAAETWAIAAIYSSRHLPWATNNAVALSGYWQPASSGWLPSISYGWGISNWSRPSGLNTVGQVVSSQSWSLGLQWQDALARGNVLGIGIGQPSFATSLIGGGTRDDGNVVIEWWYAIQVSDQITITPALFYLSRPLGEATPAGTSFNQLGALIKTSFRF